MTMLRYDSRAADQVGRDCQELEDRFRGWQGRFQEWMRFAFPAMRRAGSVLNLGTIFQTEALQETADRRSTYITEWVGSRGEALISLRFAAKTNILPALYGEAADQEAEDRLIHLSMGLLNVLDQTVIDGMGGFSWDYAMKQHLTWCGKVAFQVRVYEDIPPVVVAVNQRGTRRGADEASPRVAGLQAPFLDVFSLYHDIGTLPGERHRVVRAFRLQWHQVRAFAAAYGGEGPARPPEKKDSDWAVCKEYWVREEDGAIRHSFLVEDQPIREEIAWTDHGYKKIPIVVVSRPAASHQFEAPQAASGIDDPRVYYHAEPFYGRAIPLLTFLQGLESLAADGAALASLPIFLHRPPDGGGGVAKPDVKPLGFLELATGEQLEILRNVSDGRTTLDSAIQRIKGELNDIFPDFLVGTSGPANISGFSFNSQLISQGHRFMTPWTRVDEAAKRQLLMQVFDQHKTLHSDLEWRLSGVLPEGARRVFKSSDYPKGDFDIDIQEPAEIPGKDLQDLQAAQQANQAGLVSKRTARITKLGIGQPDKEQERIDDELFHESPENQNWEKVMRFGQRVDELRKEVAAIKGGRAAKMAGQAVLAQAEQMLQGMLGMATGAPQTGFTMPQQPGNPAPNVLPPEMIPGENGEVNALAQGRQSSPAIGRPRPRGTR